MWRPLLLFLACFPSFASALEWPSATKYGYASNEAVAIVRGRFHEGTPAPIASPAIATAVELSLAAKRRIEEDFGFKNLNSQVKEARLVDRSTLMVRIEFERGGSGFEQFHLLERSPDHWKHLNYYEVPTWSVRF